MRLRGLRGRLVVAYTIAAASLFAVAGVVSVRALGANLYSTLDATLAARATPFLQALNEPGTPELPGPPGTDPGRISNGLVVLFAPTGEVRYSEPAGAAQQLGTLSGTADPAIVLTDRHLGGEPLRLRMDTVRRPDGTWRLVVGVRADTTERAYLHTRRVFVFALPALLLVVAGGTWLLAGSALRPVERMRAEAAQLGRTQASRPLTVPHTGDELEALGVTLNTLLDRLHQALGQQRDFVADAGHELRTPLAILVAELELADRPGRSAEELRAAITRTRSEATRLQRLAEDLLLLATHEQMPTRTVELLDLREVAAAAVDARDVAAARAGVRLQVRDATPCPVRGDPHDLRRAVDNLLSNALDHSPAGGEVTVIVGPDSPTTAGLAVRDSGAGFPPAFLPHAFDRFRRADPARAGETGTGLGLAIVAAIAETHGGAARASNNEPGPGATVGFTLPLAAEP